MIKTSCKYLLVHTKEREDLAKNPFQQKGDELVIVDTLDTNYIMRRTLAYNNKNINEEEYTGPYFVYKCPNDSFDEEGKVIPNYQSEYIGVYTGLGSNNYDYCRLIRDLYNAGKINEDDLNAIKNNFPGLRNLASWSRK